MSKSIVFSFDDGRLDTYTNAVPILEQHGFTATINITTDFILHPEKYNSFRSACNKAMSVSQVRELYQKGFEIASHGNEHVNEPDDVVKSIEILHDWGIDRVKGFASPTSAIDNSNIAHFISLVERGVLSYIRSGLQVRKQGKIYTFLYLIQNLFKSKYLFFSLNKKTIIGAEIKHRMVLGVSVSERTTVEQMMYLIRKMPEDSTVVFIFHSILSFGDSGYGLDKWYWDKKQFERLCQTLSVHEGISVIKNIDIYEKTQI